MAAGVRTALRGAGTASDHRAGSPGDFWRRQRLLRDAPARRLQREGPTRTQFPPAPARMAPGTNICMIFETERLVLDTWQISDWTALRPIATDVEVMRYITGG